MDSDTANLSRENVIRSAFEDFRGKRRLPVRELVLHWCDQWLTAVGMERLSEDERRLVQAHADCDWAVPYTPPEERWPDMSPVAAKTAVEADLFASLRERAEGSDGCESCRGGG